MPSSFSPSPFSPSNAFAAPLDAPLDAASLLRRRDLATPKRAFAWLRDADLLLVQTGGPVPWLGRGLHGHVATVARWGGDWFVLETRPGGGRAVPLDAFLRRNRRRVDVFRPNPDGRWPEYRPEKCVAFLRRAVSARYGWRGVCSAAVARLPFVRLLWRDEYFNDGDLARDAVRDDVRDLARDVARDDVRNLARDVSPQRRDDGPLNDAFLRFKPTCEREELDEIWRFDRELQRRASLHCAEARALADRYAGVDSVPFLNDRFVEPADLARSPFYRYQWTFGPLARRAPL